MPSRKLDAARVFRAIEELAHPINVLRLVVDKWLAGGEAVEHIDGDALHDRIGGEAKNPVAGAGVEDGGAGGVDVITDGAVAGIGRRRRRDMEIRRRAVGGLDGETVLRAVIESAVDLD